MDSQLRSLTKRRTSNFREDETKLLIHLWGSPQIQNKLYLTHRKAPVMRLLAANMQRHGFYRTPDEIKTRIRNLKCLYHRIKRTMQSGAGIGTVDPDWPHFKAMDNILARQVKKDTLYKDNIFEGPKCEDIKQEIEDIDINEDSIEPCSDDDDDEHNTLPILTPAPKEEFPEPPSPPESPETAASPAPPATMPTNQLIAPKPSLQQQAKQIKNLPTLLPNLTNLGNLGNLANFTIPQGANGIRPNLNFPLLIVQQQKSGSATSNGNGDGANVAMPPLTSLPMQKNNTEMTDVLKQLLDVQKENLSIEKQRLELEKQRLEFDRLIGTQLLTLVPMFGGILQRVSQNETPEQSPKKRKRNSHLDILKDSKILRQVLENGIKKYMGQEFNEDDSENEDSGILLQTEENSN